MADTHNDCVSIRECTAKMEAMQLTATSLQNSVGKDDQTGMRGDLRYCRDSLNSLLVRDTEREKQLNKRDNEIKIHFNRWMGIVSTLTLLTAIFTIFHH